MKQNKTYLHLGVTLIVSACAVLMFYDTFFQSRVLLDFFDKLSLSAGTVDDLADLPLAETELGSQSTVVAAVEPGPDVPVTGVAL